MAFSFSGLVSAVVGAVAKVATAVVNALSPVAKGGGILGGIAGAIVGVAEAVLGATAEFANACEDGEIDDEEAEELLEDVFKLLVGAFIGMFGSSGSGSNSIDRKSEVLDEGTINTGKNLYTLQEANEYINCNIWGFDMGHKVYLPNQVSSLPEQIAYKSGGYTYVYELQECPPSTFNGIEIPNDDIVLGDGTILSTKLYSYGIVYTDEPKGPELLIGIVSALPGKSQFNIKGVGKPNINRRQALNQAKDSAAIPRSQQPTRQWSVGDDITKKGGNYKNYEYSDNATHYGRYYEYDTPQGKKIIVEHTNDLEQGLHTHAGEVPKGANPLTYDFKNPDNRYKPINKDTDHHIRYTDK